MTLCQPNAAEEIAASWKTDARWKGITRPYAAKDVVRLRGTLHIEYTLARLGAERLWNLLSGEKYVNALGAVSGNQAVQMVAAGLQAIYVSGWQVAADANNAGQMYPDQSLYPADSVPNLVRRLNNALIRADQIHHCEGKNGIRWFVPLIADAEAGFGGTLNAFELMKAMIEAGAACIGLWVFACIDRGRRHIPFQSVHRLADQSSIRSGNAGRLRKLPTQHPGFTLGSHQSLCPVAIWDTNVRKLCRTFFRFLPCRGCSQFLGPRDPDVCNFLSLPNEEC